MTCTIESSSGRARVWWSELSEGELRLILVSALAVVQSGPVEQVIDAFAIGVAACNELERRQT